MIVRTCQLFEDNDGDGVRGVPPQHRCRRGIAHYATSPVFLGLRHPLVVAVCTVHADSLRQSGWHVDRIPTKDLRP